MDSENKVFGREQHKKTLAMQLVSSDPMPFVGPHAFFNGPNMPYYEPLLTEANALAPGEWYYISTMELSESRIPHSIFKERGFLIREVRGETDMVQIRRKLTDFECMKVVLKVEGEATFKDEPHLSKGPLFVEEHSALLAVTGRPAMSTRKALDRIDLRTDDGNLYSVALLMPSLITDVPVIFYYRWQSEGNRNASAKSLRKAMRKSQTTGRH